MIKTNLKNNYYAIITFISILILVCINLLTEFKWIDVMYLVIIVWCFGRYAFLKLAHKEK